MMPLEMYTTWPDGHFEFFAVCEDEARFRLLAQKMFSRWRHPDIASTVLIEPDASRPVPQPHTRYVALPPGREISRIGRDDHLTARGDGAETGPKP